MLLIKLQIFQNYRILPGKMRDRTFAKLQTARSDVRRYSYPQSAHSFFIPKDRWSLCEIVQLGGNPAVLSLRFGVDPSHYVVTSAIRTPCVFLRWRDRKSPSCPGAVVGFSLSSERGGENDVRMEEKRSREREGRLAVGKRDQYASAVSTPV